jgi:acetyl esterase/lipase
VILTITAFLSLLTARVVAAQSNEAPSPDKRTFESMVADLKPSVVMTYKTIGDRDLTLHVFRPAGWDPSDRRPAHVVIHGGGWRNFSPQRFYPYANSLVDRGFVGISVEYRLASRDPKREGATTVFDCVKDARAAVRYIRAHAEALGIDPNRIAVGGGSAGAHLALSTALFNDIDHPDEDTATSCRPDALILYFAVLDTSPEGYGHDFIGPRWKELSPRHHLRKGLPPTLIFHGDRDTVAKMPVLKDFCKRLEEHDVPYQLVLEKGGVHGHLNKDMRLFDQAIEQTQTFLNEHGFAPQR